MHLQQLSLEVLVLGSGDHLHRCVRYVLSAAQGGRPYLLLMPNYVCLKPFFRRASDTPQPPLPLFPLRNLSCTDKAERHRLAAAAHVSLHGTVCL